MKSNNTEQKGDQMSMTVKQSPLLLWGDTGIGKSSAVKAFAERRKLPLITIVVAQVDPVDLCGVIVADTKRGVSKRLTPDWWVEACNKPHVIFFDEITAGTREQFTALLRATDDSRELNGMELHPESIIIAAANPPESAAGAGTYLPEPVLVRFRHIRLSCDPAVEYMMGGKGIEFDVPGKPPTPNMRTVVGTYLKRNRGAVIANEQARKMAVEKQQPFPCPRAWTRAADEEGDILRWGEFVGEEAALGFANWMQSLDLPDPDEILAGKIIIPKRGDAVMVTANTLVARLLEKAQIEELLVPAMNWFEAAANSGFAADAAPALPGIISQVGAVKIAPMRQFEPYVKMVRLAKSM